MRKIISINANPTTKYDKMVLHKEILDAYEKQRREGKRLRLWRCRKTMTEEECTIRTWARVFRRVLRYSHAWVGGR